MRTPLLDKTPEHRSRELMNLVAWGGRCATMPDADDAERLRWHEEVGRAWAELQRLASAPGATTTTTTKSVAETTAPAAVPSPGALAG